MLLRKGMNASVGWYGCRTSGRRRRDVCAICICRKTDGGQWTRTCWTRSRRETEKKPNAGCNKQDGRSHHTRNFGHPRPMSIFAAGNTNGALSWSGPKATLSPHAFLGHLGFGSARVKRPSFMRGLPISWRQTNGRRRFFRVPDADSSLCFFDVNWRGSNMGLISATGPAKEGGWQPKKTAPDT